jgi:hypothetical protein
MLMLKSHSAISPLPAYSHDLKAINTAHNKRWAKTADFLAESAIFSTRATEDGKKAKGKGKGKKGKGKGKEEDLCCLAECLGDPAPGVFTVRCSLMSVETNMGAGDERDATNLIVRDADASTKKKDVFAWSFVVHVEDTSAELDLVVNDASGKALLGVNASDLASGTTKASRTKAAKAAEDVLAVIDDIEGDEESGGVLAEIKIKSYVIGGEKVFVLAADEQFEILEE